MPYYEKVREYSDGDIRDILEFDLELPSEAINRLIEH
ncbi:MAG: hypothetical protein COB67_12300 [SAR324 cluster bacterium]|uniref:Lnb N-terminal periplasmic domain-containing protein n=1 Tax=SAR324 cluster bacterium TaxID=2024889 RepID=A0A2A4SRV9_9DELT|nr:MAG: hypothetical protein COB67_12300 [SAR324 cluster bacterium]